MPVFERHVRPGLPAGALVVLFVTAPALADDKAGDSSPPDPVAQRAGEEANLVSEERRQGFWFQGSLGGSITIGKGTGNGGAVSLKLGHVMRPTWVALLEATYNGQGHEVLDKLHINDHTTVLLGAQWWPGRQALFARAGLGYGAYRCKQCKDPDDAMNIVPVDYRRRGLASTFAVGVELVRFKAIVLGFEGSLSSSITPDGAFGSLGFHTFLSVN